MFTWICPKCGSEVSPSYSDCPRCSAATASAPAAVPPPAIEPETSQKAPPPIAPAAPATPPPTPQPPPEVVAPATFAPATPSIRRPSGRPEHSGQTRQLSPALVATLAAVGIIALLAVLYVYVLPSTSESAATASNTPGLQNPAEATTPQGAHPLAKHLEVGGLRITHANGSAKITFFVVNHSAADLPDLRLDMSVIPVSGGNAIFEFPVALSSIGPYESREIASTVKTNLKPYEIPDWQAVRPRFVVTSQP